MKFRKTMRVGERRFLEKFAFLPKRKEVVTRYRQGNAESREVEWIWLQKYWQVDAVSSYEKTEEEGTVFAFLTQDVFFDEREALNEAAKLKYQRGDSCRFHVSKSFLKKLEVEEEKARIDSRKLEEMTNIGLKDDLEELE